MSSPSAFHIMAKPRGAICNLECDYCFYLRKAELYPEASFRMSKETLESYTRQYIQSQRVPEVNFAWQGGEPTLMGLEFFRQAVVLQKKYARPGMRIENALQTNGTLLDEKWCRFFAENHFLIGISMDGPREFHDRYRHDKGASPTFDRVVQSIRLLKKHHVDFNILTCVSSANVDQPIAVYRFLRDEIGAEFLQFIPIIVMPLSTLRGLDPFAWGAIAALFAVLAVFMLRRQAWSRVASIFVQGFNIIVRILMTLGNVVRPEKAGGGVNAELAISMVLSILLSAAVLYYIEQPDIQLQMQG